MFLFTCDTPASICGTEAHSSVIVSRHISVLTWVNGGSTGTPLTCKHFLRKETLFLSNCAVYLSFHVWRWSVSRVVVNSPIAFEVIVFWPLSGTRRVSLCVKNENCVRNGKEMKRLGACQPQGGKSSLFKGKTWIQCNMFLTSKNVCVLEIESFWSMDGSGTILITWIIMTINV